MERLAGFVDKPAEEFMQAVGVFIRNTGTYVAVLKVGMGAIQSDLLTN